MGKTISFSIQKGGCGKTTTSSITAHLLSKNHKVLAVDFDSQGNMTQFLLQRNIYDFTGKTVLEAVKEGDPRPYIVPVHDNLHMLTAEDFLSTLPRYLFLEYPESNKMALLHDTLEVVKDEYDYIIIDCPPNVGELTLNALYASDYVVLLLQTEPFCYDALLRIMEIVESIQKIQPKLQLAGVLPTMLEARGAIDNSILKRTRSQYGEAVFDTVIRRRSQLKRFSLTGIQEATKADRDALAMHENFVEELLQRVK